MSDAFEGSVVNYTLVNGSAEYLINSEEHEKSRNKCSLRRNHILVGVFVHSLLIFFNLWFFSTVYQRNCIVHMEYRNLEESPAAPAISFEQRQFTFHDMDIGKKPNIYFGIPSDAIVKAWDDLTRYQNIAVSEEVMENLGRTGTYDGVKLPDGSGYLGTLNVYHALHCLQQVHRFMYRDFYLPDMSEAEMKAMLGHVEHCLEGIREYIVCKADLSLVTLRWDTEQSTPLANWTFPHVCQKWDNLEDWAKEHNVPKALEKNWLMHPTLGWAYTDATRVGATIPKGKPE